MKHLIVFLTIAASAETLTLKQAVEKAAELNPDIAIARLRIIEAEAFEGATKANYRPQLIGSIASSYQTTNLQGIGLSFPGVPSRIGPYWLFNARPILTQTIVDGGLLSSIRAARAQYEQNRHAAEAVRETTQLTVLDLYLQALQSDSRIAASKARLETARAVLQQAKDREEGGMASKLDIARADQEFHVEEATLINAERDLRVLKSALIRTIGLPGPDVTLAPLEKSPTAMLPPESTESVENRAEFQADAANIQRADFEVQRAKREYWPKIGVSADFGVLGRNPTDNVSTYTVGATATFPIWTSGRIEKEIAAAQVRAKVARESQRQTKLSIEEDIRKSLLEWEAARDAFASAEKATAAARESVELARIRFQSGLATNIDTVTAQSRLAEAEDFEIRTRYDLLRARARNARARGSISLFFEGV